MKEGDERNFIEGNGKGGEVKAFFNYIYVWFKRGEGKKNERF